MTSIHTRPLDPAEWQRFRDFRLTALQAAPGVFAISHADAMTRSEEEWRSTIRGPAHQVFGLFDDTKLIGIAGVFTERDDPSGETALLAMSFINPEYRGRDLGQMLYQCRLDWIRAQPQFIRVITCHRNSNTASRRLIERHGFLPTHSNPNDWPDGTTEDETWYELKIR